MGKSSILDGCPKKSFSLVYNIGKGFFGHPSHIDNVSIKLTSFAKSFERTENLNEVKNAFHENNYDLSPLVRYVKRGRIH